MTTPAPSAPVPFLSWGDWILLLLISSLSFFPLSISTLQVLILPSSLEEAAENTHNAVDDDKYIDTQENKREAEHT